MSRQHVEHRMRPTSLQAYGELPELGEMQRRVLNVIVEHAIKGEHLTDREIARELGYGDPNKVRPRRFELMEMGLITEAGTRACRVSGRQALTWRPLLPLAAYKVMPE